MISLVPRSQKDEEVEEKVVGPDEIKFELAKVVNLPPEQIQQKETNNLSKLNKNPKLMCTDKIQLLMRLLIRYSSTSRLESKISHW